jgi:nicotinamidase/pyrazinamidase
VIGYDTTTALVVVDLQNDFTDPKGSLFVEGADSVVPRVNIEIMRAQSAGALIVNTQDSNPDTTWGAELHPALQVSGPVVAKETSGEDITSPLQPLLEERGVERVVVVGLTLEGSVRATAIEASQRFATAVIPEASVAVDREPGDGRRAIEEMRNAGVAFP